MEEKLDEGCGCGGDTTNNIRNYTSYNKYSPDPLVGKTVNLIDGRTGTVDDSIRNSNGEVIGYVIEGDKGKYRVFKNKIAESIDIDEQDGGGMGDGGGFASLDSTPGMGDIHPPIGNEEGSGDVFPSIGFSKDRKKKGKERKRKSGKMVDTSLMNFDTFIKNSKKNQ
jgi:hypothetical protein